MKKRVVLPTETVLILEHFGTLSDVTNRILSLVESGDIDIGCLPPANIANYSNKKKVNIDITNNWYLSNEINGNTLSITRLLQYFVDNELYNDLQWEAVNNEDDNKTIVYKLLCKAHDNIGTIVSKYCKNDTELNAIFLALAEQIDKWR